MKRTSKRRLGLTGLVASAAIVIALVVSTRHSVVVARRQWSVMLHYGCMTVLHVSRMTSPTIRVHLGSLPFPSILWLPNYEHVAKTGPPVPGPAISIYSLRLPLWIPFLAFGIPSYILWRRNRKPAPGHCRTCGYDLTGNISGKCSECGKAIEQATK